MWKPVGVRVGLRPDGTHASLTESDVDRMFEVMSLGWEEGTAGSYGSGLLVYHVYCDDRAIPEHLRAPVNAIVVSVFVMCLAGAYAPKTINNYIYGIRAWHILHGKQWRVNQDELTVALRAAARLAPALSKRKERLPYTVAYIETIGQTLNANDALDAAVFACLTTTFYAAARCGETTVKNLKSFDATLNIRRAGMSYKPGSEGKAGSTNFRVPSTKTKPREGEDIYWSEEPGLTNPKAALENHFRVNNLPLEGHIFAYKVRGERKHRPLTKPRFIQRLHEAAATAGLEPLQGHGIRIGATLMYLLRGIPIETMKIKGRWASDAFRVYLRKHAQIITPLLQDAPEVHRDIASFSVVQRSTD
jgi:hypothetical protein